MAVLTAAQRAEIHERFMADESVVNTELALNKADLLAAVDAVDDWVDANAAAFNAAIPEPARTSLTAVQKVGLLSAVAHKRWEVT